MKYGRYAWSYIFLTWGLGITFIWIGVDILRNPEVWIGFVPQNLPGGIPRETALKLGGAFDIAIGVALILRFMPKIVAGLAALHLIAVLITQGVDAVLIRDVGLLGAALALLTWPTRYRKSRFLKLFQRNSRQEPSE
jgi:hypothetical protein